MVSFLSEKFSSLFSRFGGGKLLTSEVLEDSLRTIKDVLLEADVPLDLVKHFTAEIEKEVVGKKLINTMKPAEHLIKVVHDTMVRFLGGSSLNTFNFQLPATIMVMGLQGSGKTTSIGKLAFLLQEQAQMRGKKRRIMLSSVDYYRPAAGEQLEILAQKVGVTWYRSLERDPVAATIDIKRKAQEDLIDILLLDTAGRLPDDVQMRAELQGIDRALAPNYKLLVLDAMMGQQSLSIAQKFYDAVNYSGALITKMDSDTRGGVVFAFAYTLKKPILFVGVGEKLEDLQPFKPDRMAQRILGRGDMQTLLESADKKITHEEQRAVSQSLKQGRFTLDDFAQQLSMMDKLGSLTSIAKYLPGMGSVTPQMVEQGEREMKLFKAILSSMTPKERRIPQILDGSRKKRIASGAGVTTSQVNSLLFRFEQSQQYAKLFKKHGKNAFKK